MRYKEFKGRVLDCLISYKEKEIGTSKSGRWRDKEYKHILHEDEKYENFMFIEPKSYVKDKKISLHTGFAHLNSSQVMCINYFEPLIRDGLLGEFIEGIIDGLEDVVIECCKFEKLSPIDSTNFDFYVKLESGERIFFEIKYTESEFASAKNDKSHMEKIDTVYSKMAEDSKYFKDGLPEDFIKNYQLYRNMLHIQNNSDYLVLIYPYDNLSLRKQAEGVLNKGAYGNVISLDWKNISKSKYYGEFYKKYLSY